MDVQHDNIHMDKEMAAKFGYVLEIESSNIFRNVREYLNVNRNTRSLYISDMEINHESVVANEILDI